jgi:RNA-directed DNA polymerase
MAREFPGCPFERYADDGVVHCKSRRQAEFVLAAITARMTEVGLRLHPEKTRIVYCQDSSRRAEHEHTSFTFLGFMFRPRTARNSKDGTYFTSFLPAMSPEALKAKNADLRKMRIHRRTNLSLDDLARWLNPIVAGWMNYYGRYYRTVTDPPPAAPQHLPEALGREQVPAKVPVLPKVLAMVERAARTSTRSLRPLEVGPSDR